MRAANVKHVEFEILKYLLTGRGSHIGPGCQGLTDLLQTLGAEHEDGGLVIKEAEKARDKPAQKRCRNALTNLQGVLLNMMSKRTAHLPERHPNHDWDLRDCTAMVERGDE
jgi:hypothetical protein